MLDHGRLRIEREGRWRKLVERVGLLCFNGEHASRQGLRATYITERAVFRLHEGRLRLCEVAPGLDPERDVLALAPPGIDIDPALKTIDARVYLEGPMRLTHPPADRVAAAPAGRAL